MQFFLALVVLVGVSVAVPLSRDTSSALAPSVSLMHPFTDDVQRLPHDAVPRVRRSQQPGNIPTPSPTKQPTNGGVDVGVQRHPGGTQVSVDARRNVHTSNDGRTTVDVHGHYDRTFNGPAASRPHYNTGVQFQHRW